MINLCNTILAKDKVQAIPTDVGKKIKPTPVIDKIIEVDVVPMILIQSTDSNIVVTVLYFLYLFFDLLFLSMK